MQVKVGPQYRGVVQITGSPKWGLNTGVWSRLQGVQSNLNTSLNWKRQRHNIVYWFTYIWCSVICYLKLLAFSNWFAWNGELPYICTYICSYWILQQLICYSRTEDSWRLLCTAVRPLREDFHPPPSIHPHLLLSTSLHTYVRLCMLQVCLQKSWAADSHRPRNVLKSGESGRGSWPKQADECSRG